MEPKPDGRLYSRVLRRIVAVITTVPNGKKLSISEMADFIEGRNLSEFHLPRFGRTMSNDRIKDYIRYLRELEIVVPKDDAFIIQFAAKRTDMEWAQALSDRALKHLSIMLKKPPDKVFDIIENCRRKLLRGQRVPTLDSVIAEMDLGGGRSEELFRWSFNVYADGDTCPFDVRRQPILLIEIDSA
jgi:hypothetical protein